MSTHYTSLVAGVEDSGNSMNVTSPYDDSVIATVSTVDGVTVKRALATAYDIYSDRSRWLSKVKRIEILQKTADIMRSRFDELAIEAAREGGLEPEGLKLLLQVVGRLVDALGRGTAAFQRVVREVPHVRAEPIDREAGGVGELDLQLGGRHRGHRAGLGAGPRRRMRRRMRCCVSAGRLG